MKMKPIKTRKAWTDNDNNEIISLYFDFLNYQLAGVKYVKAPAVRALAEKQGRSKGSIECKLMNVSACMIDAGNHPSMVVKGYKPLSNYNKALFDAVKAYTSNSAAA